jgi:uncharacterized protein YbjT (DUF2867 family)
MHKKGDQLILVTGATGHQGGAVLSRLRAKGFPVRILARDPDKPAARSLVGSGAEVVRGDLDDPASLTRALDGVWGVYSMQATNFADIDSETRQGIALADAASQAGVSHLVYSSVASADQHTGIPHFESKNRIEEHVRNSGLSYTILRPVFFMENWLATRDQIEKGVVALPMRPQTRLQMIAVEDIGVAAAAAFEHPGHWKDRAVELAGDEMSLEGVAEVFGNLLGHPVEYRQIPWDRFEQQAGQELTIMFHWLDEVGYSIDISALRSEIPNLTSFERWVHAHFQPASTDQKTKSG